MREPPPVKPGHVRRTANVFWRAGAYPFEGKGTFEMSPEECRRAVERFSPVPFDYAHRPGPLDGKLGEVVALFPASADFSELGYHADVPEWLDKLHRDEQGNPLPLNVSATWGWTGKELRRVALVNEPRIPEAAMFEACFSATGYCPECGRDHADCAHFAYAAPAPGMDQPTNIDPDALDPGHEATLEITADPEDPDGEKKLRNLKALAESMGCKVEEGEDEPDDDDQPPQTTNPAEGDTMPAPVQAAFEREIAELKRRDAAREQELADLKKREEERAVRDTEARFERTKADAKRDGEAFARDVWKADKVHVYQREAVVAEFVQAALDDARHPEEVYFSAEGEDGTYQTKKGTRIEALKARYAALPKLGMLGELIPDREEATFDVASGPPSKHKASPATVNRILASCDMGQAALARLRERNGKH